MRGVVACENAVPGRAYGYATNLQCNPRLTSWTTRRRRVPRPRGLQLLLRDGAAREAAGQDPGEQVGAGDAQPPGRHRRHLPRPGLAGDLPAILIGAARRGGRRAIGRRLRTALGTSRAVSCGRVDDVHALT